MIAYLKNGGNGGNGGGKGRKLADEVDVAG
jgi:hypothetical protein